MMMHFDPQFVQTRRKTEGANTAKTRLNAINAKAIQLVNKNICARIDVILHQTSLNIHWFPKYTLA